MPQTAAATSSVTPLAFERKSLPPEIWGEVIEIALSSHLWGGATYSTLFRMIHTCKEWRSYIKDTSSLWRYVMIDTEWLRKHRSQRPEANIKLALESHREYSGIKPINLFIYLRPDPLDGSGNSNCTDRKQLLDDILEFVRHESISSRLKFVSIDGYWPNLAEDFFSEGVTFPSLDTFHFQSLGDFYFPETAVQAPRLKNLIIGESSRVLLAPHDTGIPETVEHFEILGESLFNVVTIYIPHFRRLKKLCLWQTLCDEQKFDDALSDSIQTLSLHVSCRHYCTSILGFVTLPSLNSLSLCMEIDGSDSCNIERVSKDIGNPASALFDFLSRSNCGATLQKLKLIGLEPDDESTPWRKVLQSLVGLKKLVIDLDTLCSVASLLADTTSLLPSLKILKVNMDPKNKEQVDVAVQLIRQRVESLDTMEIVIQENYTTSAMSETDWENIRNVFLGDPDLKEKMEVAVQTKKGVKMERKVGLWWR